MSKTPYYIRHIDTNTTEPTDGLWLDKVGEDTARRISVNDFVNSITYQSITLIAGESIVSDRAVVVDSGSVFHFDTTNSTYYGRSVGVSKNSANIGETVEVIVSGYYNSGLSLTEGQKYYATSTGALSTTPPTSGIVQIIGIALTSSKFLVDSKLSIQKV